MSEDDKKPWHEIEISRYRQSTGVLSVMESESHIPFLVKRVFWIHAVPDTNVERGGHAHADLNQVIFCAQGSCQLELVSKNGKKQLFDMSDNSAAIFLEGLVWRMMRNFSSDCSLMVLCDRPYNEDRVITNYDEFLKS